MKQDSIYSFLYDNSYLVPFFVACITAVMLFLTLVPSNMLGQSSIWGYDKLGHLLMFGSWTFFAGLYVYINTKSSLSLWAIFVIGVLFGGLIELLQYIMPFHRDPDLFDLIFDAIGSLGAVLLLKFTLPSPKEPTTISK